MNFHNRIAPFAVGNAEKVCPVYWFALMPGKKEGKQKEL